MVTVSATTKSLELAHMLRMQAGEMKGRSTSLNVKKFSESSYFFASKDHNLMTRLHTFDEIGLYAALLSL